MQKTKTKTTFKLVKRLLKEHIRPYFAWVILSLVFMILAAAATAALAKLLQPIIDDVFDQKDVTLLITVSLMIIVVFIVKGLATYGEAVTMNYIGQKIIGDIQKRLFAHLMRADLSFFHARPTGILISRFTNDITLMQQAVSKALTGIGKDTITIIFLVGLMFYQDWFLAAISIFVFPAAIYPIAKFGRRMRKVSSNTQEKMGSWTTLLKQVFHGARLIKTYGMQVYEQARAGEMIESLRHLNQKACRVRSALHPIMEGLAGIAIVIVISYGGWQVIHGAQTKGAFISFIGALLLAYEPMKRLANLNANLQEGLAAAERVFEDLDTAPRIVSKKQAPSLSLTKGAIEFKRVSFHYGEDRPTLHDVTMSVAAGDTVGLVGPSGSGKSTIINLISRFYDISQGVIEIDEQDIREVAIDSLRAHIALVSQEITLFHDTVEANIRYGRLDATESQVIEAAKRAHAHEFIQALPQGYQTLVGEDGIRLSGGQRQRLAIARAMIKDAPILLLDEATSALDSASEAVVQDALKDLMKGRTTLIVTHRLSTVKQANIIYVLEKGRIVEQGKHEALLHQQGAYAKLWAMQNIEKLSA